MELKLSEAAAADWEAIRPEYLAAFPREERAPFRFVRSRARRGRARMLVARDGEAFVGFAYLVCRRDLAYLFYFAVAAERRGQGYGSAILRALKEEYRGKRLFLARERLDEPAENLDQRRRRHEFYLRSGFEDLPGRITEAGVVYDVMGIGGPISPAEYRDLITPWSGPLRRRLLGLRLLEP